MAETYRRAAIGRSNMLM